MTDQEERPVLVCGLGAFGQAVLSRLLTFGTPLRLIDRCRPDWRSGGLETAGQAALTLGDMRKPHVLRQADVEQARSVLLLSPDSGVNVEAALQVRLLNASAEIVIRSSSSDLDQLGSLLEQRLPGLVVVNPLQLSAGALVQALRPGPQLARFDVNGEAFEVRDIALEDHRFQRPVRLEQQQASLVVQARTFYSPQPERRSSPGVNARIAAVRSLWRRPLGLSRRALAWLRSCNRIQLAVMLLVITMAGLGIHLFASSGGWVQGLFVTSALLKGDYVDPTNVVLGQGGGPHERDAALISVTLLYSLVGTLLSSALVALILDQLLVARFGTRRRRRLHRQAQPILLLGGGALAGRVATMLSRERHTVVRVEASEPPRQEDRQSLFCTSLEQAQKLLRDATVSGVAMLSGELLTDLQQTLELQRLWPQARFATLALREGTGERLGDLLGGASLISPIELGADVVVATAFGERVEAVWRIHAENLLQVRYQVEADDTLAGKTISRLENGYGLTVLSLQRHRQAQSLAMPFGGTVVAVGDQLVVLASLPALRRVEQGEIRPPGQLLTLQRPEVLDQELSLVLQQILARQLGLAPSEAAELLRGSAPLRLRVDPDCGALLLRDLQRQSIPACLSDASPGPAPAGLEHG